MDEKPLSETDTRNLRFLRLLVLVLTGTMILGMAVLVGLFATRFPGGSDPAVADLSLPKGFEIPAGEHVAAVTRAQTFWVVVTEAGDLYFFEPAGGAPVRHIPFGD